MPPPPHPPPPVLLIGNSEKDGVTESFKEKRCQGLYFRKLILFSNRERAVPKPPRALGLLTLLILSVPAKSHSRKTGIIKNLQSRVHRTPTLKGRFLLPGGTYGISITPDPQFFALCAETRIRLRQVLFLPGLGFLHQ